MVRNEVEVVEAFDEHFWDERNDARCLAHLLGYFFAGVFIFRTQFGLAVKAVQVFQTEHSDRHVTASDLFPVGDVFVEKLLDLFGAETLNVVRLVESQHVAFFHDGLAEKSGAFAEQKADNQENDDARHKAAQREYLAGDSVNPFLHGGVLMVDRCC